MFTYSLSIFLTSTAFVDTKCKIRHISFEICRIFENCPLEYTPFENGFLYGASVHNQSLTRGKNLKKRRASARKIHVEAFDYKLFLSLIVLKISTVHKNIRIKDGDTVIAAVELIYVIFGHKILPIICVFYFFIFVMFKRHKIFLLAFLISEPVIH